MAGESPENLDRNPESEQQICQELLDILGTEYWQAIQCSDSGSVKIYPKQLGFILDVSGLGPQPVIDQEIGLAMEPSNIEELFEDGIFSAMLTTRKLTDSSALIKVSAMNLNARSVETWFVLSGDGVSSVWQEFNSSSANPEVTNKETIIWIADGVGNEELLHLSQYTTPKPGKPPKPGLYSLRVDGNKHTLKPINMPEGFSWSEVLTGLKDLMSNPPLVSSKSD